MSNLRSKTLRIASSLPVGDPTRKKLLSVLGYSMGKVGGVILPRYNARDVEDMTPEDAMEALEGLAAVVGNNAREFIDFHRSEAWESNRSADALEKAWDKWDWDRLADFNVLTRNEAEFAAEVLASYSAKPHRDLDRYSRG